VHHLQTGHVHIADGGCQAIVYLGQDGHAHSDGSALGEFAIHELHGGTWFMSVSRSVCSPCESRAIVIFYQPVAPD